MKVFLVLPTYNERANIGRMISSLDQVFQTLRHDMNILVVDDNSPDGTQDVVREYQTTRPYLHLITGQKQGLGKAYIRGMEEALRLGADAVFEMDSDFSHDPWDVPRLLKALEDGADFVIGSRYVPGGSIPAEWSTYRKLNSKFGNIVARYVAGIYPVRDCTAGFRCIRARVLQDVDLATIRTQGYGFQVSLLHAAYISGARIREIPVKFTDRVEGESKLGFQDIIEFIVNAWSIRLRGLETFARFCVVGFSGVIVNLGLFSLLHAAGLSKYIASPLAIEASILWNFTLNHKWTFAQRQNQRRTAIKGLQFNLVSLVSLGISFGTFVLLSHLFPEGSPHLFQVCGIIPATAVNYFLNSYWTFVDRGRVVSDGTPASETPSRH
ncbi:GtrA family protein [Oligoflexus tunisiensis]|uniref:GtrA family protein n=1 Tax=Oligoflexus tunisiensis TaxID=708132 RepID=UPI00114CB95F|nr:glycosyltransferase family 2 protein [Oligoflexus tunisiensis]